MIRYKTILAIGTHSDDLELGCFGFLLKQADLGAKIFLLTATPDSTSITRTESRALESINAASLIKNAEALILSNNRITYDHYPILVENIRKIMVDNKIDLVLINHPDDTHQEHRLLNKITMTATRRLPVSVFQYKTPSTGQNFKSNIFVDIQNYYHTKIQAIKMHTSEKDKPFMQDKYLEQINISDAATLLGLGYVEQFEILKVVDK